MSLVLINPYRFATSGGGGATDPRFANVALLLNMGGADGSTTFTDSSPSPFTVTTNGNAQIDTSLGYNTGLLDGNGDYLNIGTNVPAGLQLGSSDFSIDFWVYTLGGGTYAICGNLDDGTGNGHYWVVLNSNFGGAHTVQFGIQGTTYRFGTSALTSGTLHHIELSRSGTNLRCFLNGTQLGTTQTLNNFTGTTSLPFRIGSTSGGGNANYLFGHLRVLRITKGVARNTSNFTPPSAPFPTS